jgi:hypothetical protein
MNGTKLRIDEFLDRGNQVTETVARTARVAAQFLPKYTLPPSAKSVLIDKINDLGQLDDVQTRPLTEIRVPFTVDWQQLSGDLATALYLVRKAAQTYSRVEDRLLIWGQGNAGNQLPFGPGVQRVSKTVGAEVERGYPSDGLISGNATNVLRADIYESISIAYRKLEDKATVGPWALAMADDIFDLAERTRVGFIESPRQQIENLLGSKIYRTSILPLGKAVLMGGAATSQSESAVSGPDEPAGPVDRAVALEPELRYLGPDQRGRHDFFIVGSLTLRIRDKDGLIALEFV